ncbi:P63C domain-containing protein [Pedobacter nototheniae]|uniref:P63C domain-containing protein n=1 Tax=Pedobacter nototheniae TaxID=2488994 RepID=UPI00292D334C|nr:P63C domain-containing protein [Pedobacter nototheniae]
MKKRENNKIVDSFSQPNVDKKQDQLSKEALQELIFDLTEAPVKEKFSDFNLDRENEKILLTGGREISLSDIKDNLDKFITAYASEYTKRFPQSFYDEIYRLNNWPIPKNKTFRKYIVGRYTNELIYRRFTNEGLSKLQRVNPYVQMFSRAFKHFQFLSDEAKIFLDQFIYEATECMKECTTWYEFRLKYGLKYNLNVQLRMFEELGLKK